MAARGQLQNFSEIIQTLLSHSPRYGDVQVIFVKFTKIQNGRHGLTSYFFCGRKN